MKCIKCSCELTNNDIGLHKKLINRGAKEYMCINCMSQYFKIPVNVLEKKIVEFKNMGCTLF